MSIENARAFAMRMKEDETFRKSFMETGSREKAMELVKARGYDFTQDELVQVREEYVAKLKESGELGDEELARVSGGTPGWCASCHMCYQ